MDENEVVEAEVLEEALGVWDDDSDTEVSEGNDVEAEAETDEADQPETEEAEETSTTEDEEESSESEEPEEPKAEDNAEALEEAKAKTAEKFTLKHLDEVKEVDRDEVITLAQKGMDYDRIRTERDSLKAEKGALNEHEAFLKELAESSGLSIEELMLNTRAKLEMDRNNRVLGYKEITLEQAKARVQEQMKTRKTESAKEPDAQAETVKEPEISNMDLKAKRDASFARFVKEFPDVKSTDIPQEVWKEFGDGSKADLTDIYSRYAYKKLRAENAELKKKETVKPRSTGSRKSNGSPTIDDDIFACWND